MYSGSNNYLWKRRRKNISNMDGGSSIIYVGGMMAMVVAGVIVAVVGSHQQAKAVEREKAVLESAIVEDLSEDEIKELNIDCLEYGQEDGGYYLDLAGKAIANDDQPIDYCMVEYAISEQQFQEINEFLNSYKKAKLTTSPNLLRTLTNVVKNSKLIRVQKNDFVSFRNIDVSIIFASKPVVSGGNVKYNMTFAETLKDENGQASIRINNAVVEYPMTEQMKKDPYFVFDRKNKAKPRITIVGSKEFNCKQPLNDEKVL